MTQNLTWHPASEPIPRPKECTVLLCLTKEGDMHAFEFDADWRGPRYLRQFYHQDYNQLVKNTIWEGVFSNAYNIPYTHWAIIEAPTYR